MKAEYRIHTQILRDEWDEFILSSPQGMLYALSGYMDAAAPDWQAIECRLDGKLIAVMPLNIQKKWLWKYSLQPQFSQFWGIYFGPQTQHLSAYKEYSLKRKIVMAVLDALPSDIRWFVHGFAPEFDYPLPFHWKGYSLGTRYTYRLDLKPELGQLEAEMGRDTKYDLKKAQKWSEMISKADDAGVLLKLVAENEKEGRSLLGKGGEEKLRKVCDFLLQEKLGSVWIAGEPGAEVAAILTGTAAGKTAYLMSAVRPDERNSGVMSVLLWHAITQSKLSGSVLFDFEGSMMEGIEAFFRGFAPRPVPYLQISKNTLPFLLRWIKK